MLIFLVTKLKETKQEKTKKKERKTKLCRTLKQLSIILFPLSSRKEKRNTLFFYFVSIKLLFTAKVTAFVLTNIALFYLFSLFVSHQTGEGKLITFQSI